MLFFETAEGTLLCTGDISVTDQRRVKGLDVQTLPQADVIVCEGTYGNRTHSNRIIALNASTTWVRDRCSPKGHLVRSWACCVYT